MGKIVIRLNGIVRLQSNTLLLVWLINHRRMRGEDYGSQLCL